MRLNCILDLFLVFCLNLYSSVFTKKYKVEKSSITDPISDVVLLNNLPDSQRKDKVGDIVSYFFNVFVEIWFLIH